MKHKRHTGKIILAALIIICAALLLLGKYGLCVTRYELAFPSLPEPFDGFRVVQLSDLHGSRFGRDDFRLIAAVAGEAPDIIVLTGDFLDEGKSRSKLPELRRLVSSLADLAPVYFVSGNHDWASGDIELLAQLLEDSGADYLRNEYLLLEREGAHITLCGAEDPNGRADMITPPDLVSAARAENPGGFLLLLGHRNYWADRYPEIDADLILCGHAHGGIIRLPFLGGVLGTNAGLFPDYDAGLFQTGGRAMIVSRGLGNSVPVPRFLNTPEIVSVTLRTK